MNCFQNMISTLEMGEFLVEENQLVDLLPFVPRRPIGAERLSWL